MRTTFALTALIALVACNKAGEAVNNAMDEVIPTNVTEPVPDNASVTAVDDKTVDRQAGDEKAGASPEATKPSVVPVALQGRWTGLQNDCADRSADMELNITPTQFQFYESVGTVRGVAPGSAGRFAVDAQFAGEGETWDRTLQVRTSDDGSRLTVTNDGTAIVRKRCAAA